MNQRDILAAAAASDIVRACTDLRSLPFSSSTNAAECQNDVQRRPSALESLLLIDIEDRIHYFFDECQYVIGAPVLILLSAESFKEAVPLCHTRMRVGDTTFG